MFTARTMLRLTYTDLAVAKGVSQPQAVPATREPGRRSDRLDDTDLHKT